MKIILVLFTLIAGFFMLTFLLSLGLVARLLGAFKPRKSPDDMLLLNNLATLTANERSVLNDSLARNDQTIGALGDMESLNALQAKNIITENEEGSGIISYRITDTAWQYLQVSRAQFR